MTERQKLVIVQYGDYGEAFRRLQAGGEEDYGYQRYTVDYVAELSKQLPVVNLCIGASEGPRELAPNLFAEAISRDAANQPKVLGAVLNRIDPSMVVCRAPHFPTISWASRTKVPLLPMFADFMSFRRLGDLRRVLQLAWAIHRAKVPCATNHSVSSTRSLRLLGLPLQKLVSWEYPQPFVDSSPRILDHRPQPLKVFYAGALIEPKGVRTLLEAVERLWQTGMETQLTLAGSGNIDPWLADLDLVRRHGAVNALGQVPTTQVRALMQASDVVVVPSLHGYAEGFPNTIREALATRCPLVVSDHPAYVRRLRHGHDALVFRAGDVDDLARQLQLLAEDRDMAQQLSNHAPAAIDRLQEGIEWAELLRRFVWDPENRSNWVSGVSLAAADRKGADPV